MFRSFLSLDMSSVWIGWTERLMCCWCDGERRETAAPQATDMH
jgi:hypothetical protein